MIGSARGLGGRRTLVLVLLRKVRTKMIEASQIRRSTRISCKLAMV